MALVFVLGAAAALIAHATATLLSTVCGASRWRSVPTAYPYRWVAVLLYASASSYGVLYTRTAAQAVNPSQRSVG